MKSHKIKTQRVVAELTREQMDMLDRIGKDALYSTGYKLSRNKIICALIDILMELGIDGKDLKDETMFKERIMQAFKNKLESSHQPRGGEIVTPHKIMMSSDTGVAVCSGKRKEKNEKR